MTIRKAFSLACVSIALSALSASAADTQTQPVAKRSATKPRARSFNPYDVRRTRLKINGLGFFTLLPSDSGATSVTAVPPAAVDTTTNQPIQTSSVSASAIQQPATSVTTTAAQTTVPTAQIVSAAAAELSPSALSSAAAANFIAASSVFVSPTVAADTFTSTRPPFRPPVRSPFRPPPRPPF